MRVSKILAQAGLASRRGAEALLEAGRVTINGVVRREPGAQADPATDTIALDGRPVGAREAHAYVLLHKPPGYVTSLRDPEGRRVVTDLVPAGTPRVFGPRDLDRWRRGVTLPDGPAVPSAVRILSHGKASTWLSVTFREGRYREVKRYCKALGHPVMRLRRVQFGPLRLGTLPLGRTRALTAGELERLQNLLDPGGSPILPGIRR